MTYRDANGQESGPTIDVVSRRDVEDYAARRPQDNETIERIERVLLDDDAARQVVREGLQEGDEIRAWTQGLLFEPLQDLHEAAASCSAHAELYDQICTRIENHITCRFAERRHRAFCGAADRLTRPMRQHPAEIPDTDTSETCLLAGQAIDRLTRQLCNSPAAALRALEELHRPLMRKLRTLIHLTWPLAAKLAIADIYAELREELESGAWHLRRRLNPGNSAVRSRHPV